MSNGHEPDPYAPPRAYAPPSAELGSGVRPASRRIAWKFYFLLMAALLALIVGFVAVDPSWVQLADALDIGVSLIGLAGLFGFAFRRAISTRGFWSLWLPLQLFWDAVVTFVLEPAGLAYQMADAEPTTLLENALGFAFVLPLYVGLYLYAHRSPEIWRSA